MAGAPFRLEIPIGLRALPPLPLLDMVWRCSVCRGPMLGWQTWRSLGACDAMHLDRFRGLLLYFKPSEHVDAVPIAPHYWIARCQYCQWEHEAEENEPDTQVVDYLYRTRRQ